MTAFTAFELSIIHSINSLSTPFLDFLAKTVTATGDFSAIWIVATIILLCFRKTRKCGFTLAFSLIFCLIFNNLILKNLIARPRPFAVDETIKLIIAAPSEYSFPSGHSLASACAATIILFYNRNVIGAAAVIWAVLIGFSRIYLQVHFPSDVLGGFAIGTVFGFACIYLVDLIYKKIKQKGA